MRRPGMWQGGKIFHYSPNAQTKPYMTLQHQGLLPSFGDDDASGTINRAEQEQLAQLDLQGFGADGSLPIKEVATSGGINITDSIFYGSIIALVIALGLVIFIYRED